MNVRKLCAVSIVAIFVVLVVFSSPTSAQAGLGFTVRLHGGLGYLSGGDLNSGVNGLIDFYKTVYTASGALSNGNFEPAHFGPAFGGDLILQFSPMFGIGIGTGYIQASKESSIVLTYLNKTYTLSAAPELHSIPIKLNLFVSIPSGPTTFNFHAGLGYYLSKLSYILRFEGAAAFAQEDARLNTRGGFGFQGGIGVEFHIASMVYLFIETEGRYVTIDGFEGTKVSTATGFPTNTTTGKLYNFEQVTAIGNYRWIVVLDYDITQIPAAKAREAKIDFSGVALVVGLAFRI